MTTSFIVTGSPVQAFVDAVRTALEADATVVALVTAVTGHVSEEMRQQYPYVVLGHRVADPAGAGAMTLPGSRITLQLDWWSRHKGPSEAEAIASAVFRCLERRALPVSGFELLRGSLTCELQQVFDEPDPDMPNQRLYHGLQRWAALITETS